MKYLLVVIASFFMVTAYGKTFHDIEFELPQEAASWSCEPICHARLKALVYSPDETNENFEFFSVTLFPSAFELANSSTLAELFTRSYPDLDVTFQVLDTYADGLLYYWSAKDQIEEKIYGWGRVFLTHSALVQLNYASVKNDSHELAESIWLPVLIDAKNHSHFP
jgi:hypothetical protein